MVLVTITLGHWIQTATVLQERPKWNVIFRRNLLTLPAAKPKTSTCLTKRQSLITYESFSCLDLTASVSTTGMKVEGRQDHPTHRPTTQYHLMTAFTGSDYILEQKVALLKQPSMPRWMRLLKQRTVKVMNHMMIASLTI